MAPWPARLFLVSFVGAVAVCGAFSIEDWPLTWFRLFSRERPEVCVVVVFVSWPSVAAGGAILAGHASRSSS